LNSSHIHAVCTRDSHMQGGPNDDDDDGGGGGGGHDDDDDDDDDAHFYVFHVQWHALLVCVWKVGAWGGVGEWSVGDVAGE
jgi:hypothetical protein